MFWAIKLKKMKKKPFHNWKLKEAKNHISLFNEDAICFIDKKFEELNIKTTEHNHFFRGETIIDWKCISGYYKLFFDLEGEEEKIMNLLKKSKIGRSKNIYIAYLQDNIVVRTPFNVFVKDWEGFVRSTLYNGIIFSENFEFIIEITRDYYFHSNFGIDI
jgi:hypothetical protein